MKQCMGGNCSSRANCPAYNMLPVIGQEPAERLCGPTEHIHVVMPHLSASQRLTLRHLCNGLENAEIAEVMGITVHTVKTHLKMVMARTAMRSRLMLAVTAVKNHWV